MICSIVTQSELPRSAIPKNVAFTMELSEEAEIDSQHCYKLLKLSLATCKVVSMFLPRKKLGRDILRIFVIAVFHRLFPTTFSPLCRVTVTLVEFKWNRSWKKAGFLERLGAFGVRRNKAIHVARSTRNCSSRRGVASLVLARFIRLPYARTTQSSSR